MSLSYSHFLIPIDSTLRPKAAQIVSFMQGTIGNGHVARGAEISFSRVTKTPRPPLQGRNPFTGETIVVPRPSRSTAKPEILSDTSAIEKLVGGEAEYDIAASSTGIPNTPPLIVGAPSPGGWREMTGAYWLEVRCRVRASIVRLSLLASADGDGDPTISSVDERSFVDCTFRIVDLVSVEARYWMHWRAS